MRTLPLTLLLLGLTGCATFDKPKPPPRPAVVALPPTKADVWQGVASAADIDRLNRLPMAWTDGLKEARVRFAGAVRGEGDLLRPAAGLARPAPSPGSYNCRLVRLGKTDARSPAFVSFKPFFCYVDVENDLLTFVKQTGSERPAGRLWDDDNPRRLVFLGTVALGSEPQNKPYGTDQRRDIAGVLERIGPMRFRLLMPWSRSGSKLDIYELTPVAEQPAG